MTPIGAQDPARIGRYAVRAVLGRGAMGVVYQAHDPEIDRLVAIKLVRADLLEGEERAEYLARFRREAQAAGRCAHPNIVAVHDFALHEGNPFIAMEYVAGVSLAEALARGSVFAPAEAVAILRQVLRALAAAHAQGVVHRDIKPANILLREGGGVKVTDFGISRLDTTQLTQDGAVIGTPSYMSPEQCRGEGTDAQSDLFSAGVVLFEMLAGRRPFPGRSYAEVAHRLLHMPPVDLPPGLPPALAAAVLRALVKRPDARFPSAAAMERMLAAALGGAAEDAGESTIVIAPAASPGVFDTALVQTIERRLARHVGPIAQRLVQSAARHASSLEGLCDSLARSIAEEPARRAFLDGALGLVRTHASARHLATTGAAGLPAEDLTRVQQELTRSVGPIARVLVRRAAPLAETEAALRASLAHHIADPAQRAAFVRAR
jgi:serine/threonine-protein kinase